MPWLGVTDRAPPTRGVVVSSRSGPHARFARCRRRRRRSKALATHHAGGFLGVLFVVGFDALPAPELAATRRERAGILTRDRL